MKIIAWLLPFFFVVCSIQAQEPPKISTTREGVVNRHEVEGNLASTRPLGCITISEVKNSFTPPDLYGGVRACIDLDDYDVSVGLFALAGMYGSFDSERVADKTVAQGMTVLIMKTFSNLSADKKERFNTALNRMAETPSLLDALCVGIKNVGMPDYYPDYLIRHGLRAFTGNPHEGELISDFNGPKIWSDLLSTYLKCSAH